MAFPEDFIKQYFGPPEEEEDKSGDYFFNQPQNIEPINFSKWSQVSGDIGSPETHSGYRLANFFKNTFGSGKDRNIEPIPQQPKSLSFDNISDQNVSEYIQEPMPSPQVQNIASQIYGYDIPERPAPIAQTDLPAMPEYESPPEVEQMMQLLLQQAQPVQENPWIRSARQAAALFSDSPVEAMGQLTEKKRNEQQQRENLMRQQLTQLAGMKAKTAEQEAQRAYEDEIRSRNEQIALMEAERNEKLKSREEQITLNKFKTEQQVGLAEEQRQIESQKDKEFRAIQREREAVATAMRMKELEGKPEVERKTHLTNVDSPQKLLKAWSDILGIDSQDNIPLNELFDLVPKKYRIDLSKEYEHIMGVPVYTASEDLLSLYRIKYDSNSSGEDIEEAQTLAKQAYMRFLNRGGTEDMLYPDALKAIKLLEE